MRRAQGVGMVKRIGSDDYPHSQFVSYIFRGFKRTEDRQVFGTLCGAQCGVDTLNRRDIVSNLYRINAPGTTRTCDLLVRSQTLYPTELRARERITDFAFAQI
jgi:hypothetical protein